MAPDFIVLSIPLFFLLIGVELAYARWKRLDYYNIPDAVGSMGTGVMEQLITALVNAVISWELYSWVYEHFAFVRFEQASGYWLWALYAGAFLAVDLMYYWWHRASHVVNFLWAAHVVHHQSEEYNLTTALRQNWLTNLTALPFYLPVAVLGVSPVVFATVKAFVILYQFWIHTRTIGQMGPLEWVLNTPSHHRVHHGINPSYVDKNYGGTFIFWDRLFGTFEAEKEEPRYGVLKPLRSWNAVWAHVDPWVATYQEARRFKSPLDRLLIWFRHPGWDPSKRGVDLNTLFKEASRSRFWVKTELGIRVYVLLQFVLILGVTAFFLFNPKMFGIEAKVAIVAWICLSVYSLGALSEKKPFAPYLEALRIALVGCAYFIF